MSRSKQQIYSDMLYYGLLYVRNKSEDTEGCAAIADLLHNVPRYILSETFTEDDLYFLNVEVKGYIAYSRLKGFTPDESLLSLSVELRQAVPLMMRFKLVNVETN